MTVSIYSTDSVPAWNAMKLLSNFLLLLFFIATINSDQVMLLSL